MIELKDDRLTFTFPEITRQLTALLEQHIQQLLPKLPLPVDRNQLVEAMYQQIEESGGTLGLRHDVPLVKPKPPIFMKNGRELPQSRYQSLDDTAKLFGLTFDHASRMYGDMISASSSPEFMTG